MPTIGAELIGSFAIISKDYGDLIGLTGIITAVQCNQNQEMQVKLTFSLENLDQRSYIWIPLEDIKALGNPNKKPLIKILFEEFFKD